MGDPGCVAKFANSRSAGTLDKKYSGFQVNGRHLILVGFLVDATELPKVINLSLIKLKTAVNMPQAFTIIASSIFVLLGVVHGVLALKDLKNPRTFTPLDAALREAMQESPIAIHPNTNLWRAWIGFNLSHSLGIIFFGGAFLYIGIYQPLLFTQSLVLQVCAIVISAIYVVLSVKFWFINPAIGSGVALTCFSLATLMSYI